MNIKQARAKVFQQLSEKQNPKIDNPELETDLIISWAIEKPKPYIFAYGEKILTANQQKAIFQTTKMRLSNLPLAYVTKEKYFYGLRFAINENCLIPRPETEILVDQALQVAKKFPTSNIIDVGTGSGCIIVSVAKSLKQRQNYTFFAIEKSQTALGLAKQNALHHGLSNQITFLNGNLLEPIIAKHQLLDKKQTIILANLPYLTKAEFQQEPSIQAEPKQALVGGFDGLKYIKELLVHSKKINNLVYLILEIGYNQANAIKKLCKKNFRQAKLKVIKDLGNFDRVLIIKIEK